LKPKKKSRRDRGLGLDSGLDLAISRFIYSFGFATPQGGLKFQKWEEDTNLYFFASQEREDNSL
jgi:hypothetical protein